MSKKILAVVLALAMTLGMVCMMTGCGGSSSSDEATLTIWTHNDEDSWNESYQSIVDAYMEEHPDVTINIESFPYDEYESKVQTALMSKEGGADIYELWGGWGVDYAPSGALQQLPEEMEAEVRDDAATTAVPGALNWGQFAADVTSPLSRVDRNERHALLRAAVAALPENDRAIIVLRHFDGMGNSECAAALGIEPKAASIRYVRALERLQQKLMELSCFKK